MVLPLEGIRVLDLSIWQQGPYASALLADMGADVIKVEGPDRQDPGRAFIFDGRRGLSAYFESHNRNKRAIAVDLRHPKGTGVLLTLAATADVFLHNSRAGAMEKLGLGYEMVRRVNRSIIYAWASAFGEEGPDAALGALDLLGQARGGLMSVTGEPDDPPLPAGVPVADQVGAMMMAVGILGALVHRQRTGEGQRVTSSLLGSQLALQSFNITHHLLTGHVPRRQPRAGPIPSWNVYRGSDGRYFVLGMLQEGWWERFCNTIGRPELAPNPRFGSFRERAVNAAELTAILDEHFATQPAGHWVRALCDHDLLAAPVQNYAEVVQDPQVLANDYIVEVPRDGEAPPIRMVNTGLRFSATPVGVRRAAPGFGQHTEEVLLEAGYTREEIESLRAEGVIGVRGEGAGR